MTKGFRIRKARSDAGLSQADLAKLIHVSKQTLYKYENDIVTNIPSDKIYNIASVCGCTPAFLMGWEDDKESIEEKLINSYINIPKTRELILYAGGIEPGVTRDKYIEAVMTALKAMQEANKIG